MSGESKISGSAVNDPQMVRLAKALPGFNVAEALARLDNNITCFKELLADLYNSLDEALAALRPLIRDGGIKEALIRLHDLKGMSGNLGATSLNQIIQKLERALATSPENEYEILIIRMEQTIHQNLTAISAFLKAETCSPADPSRPVPANERLLLETMNLLACLLDQGRLDAVDVFKQLKGLLHHRQPHPEFNNLGAAIRCLDYANARKSLAAVAASMNIVL